MRSALDETQTARGERVLVACSGGLDSQVLLDVLAHVARDGRIAIIAHGVDHGLRAEARDELEHAARLAKERDVEFAITRVSLRPGSNLQARAREKRYAALHAAARSSRASLVATGHHLDDRAETVLIRILRGAPLAGLAVLPLRSHEKTQDRLRPLLAARRSVLAAHAEKRSLPFALDPSNLDRRNLRVRVRLDVMPVLRALDPRIDEHLTGLADDAIRYAFERDGGQAETGDGKRNANATTRHRCPSSPAWARRAPRAVPSGPFATPRSCAIHAPVWNFRPMQRHDGTLWTGSSSHPHPGALSTASRVVGADVCMTSPGGERGREIAQSLLRYRNGRKARSLRRSALSEEVRTPQD